MKLSNLAATERALFCEQWENAKAVLTIIEGASSNLFVKIGISIVITAGDKLKGLMCGSMAVS